jgi:hypothetical protein
MDHNQVLSILPISSTYYRQFTQVALFLAHNEGKWGGGSKVRSFLTLTLDEREWSFYLLASLPYHKL